MILKIERKDINFLLEILTNLLVIKRTHYLHVSSSLSGDNYLRWEEVSLRGKESNAVRSPEARGMNRRREEEGLT